ncbi:regulatory protein RecX [Pedobacter cryophilus]|uniref:Regulatory protein RecX n=1 Tax=Pedobacter cryophilus TaxID=2571271 RepID=A0A4U1BZ31_9SPHI|nr:regulatory protein RecX [Pedobacter cryophilus]TKB97869.1 regulatory protein RecX [Pedobacter cryophilus]
MEKKIPQYIDKQTATLKAESYCAYQERSQYEVRGKLLDLGMRYDELEEIIAYLIENNFLNEERFANAYARGKLRIKGWGKNKIAQGLKFKQVSLPLVKKALKNLDETEYLEKLKEVLDKKNESVKEKTAYQRNFKLTQYALSRGFERDLIFFMLKDSEL